jgi:predicted SnoaL-like aldol condensation-catalyzing enzyme
VIELVNPNDASAVRNEDNVLYHLMINKKEAEQAVAKFFAPQYIHYNPLLPDRAESWPGFLTGWPRIAPTANVLQR